MTAEIVIMNKSSVALAADSAVTVSSPAGTKVYNSANKLFMLTKADPVAVMIYGSAHYLGMPWETIVKEFRASSEAKTYDHLEDYANALIRYISSADHLLDEASGHDQAIGVVAGYYANVVRERINEAVAERITARGSVTEAQTKLIIRRIVQEEAEEAEAAPLLHGVEPSMFTSLGRRLSEQLSAAIDAVFQQLPLSRASKSLLKRLGLSILLRWGAWPDSAVTGVVIAGFGAHDYYPRSFHFMPRARIDGAFYHTEPEIAAVTDEQSGIVQAYAQHEMVRTFLEGIDPRFKEAMIAWVGKLMDGLSNLEPALAQVTQTVIEDCDRHLSELSEMNFQNDVLGTVSILPKDELAAMAESLVNLTSFKRRVTMAPESVGGPIDVAVVSRGDGLVWIKRKHYFTPEMNPHFFARY